MTKVRRTNRVKWNHLVLSLLYNRIPLTTLHLVGPWHHSRDMSKLPLGVRITDAVHRAAVLGLVGISVVGTGSIFFNIWANSDFARMNKNKLKFNKADYEETRAAQADSRT